MKSGHEGCAHYVWRRGRQPARRNAAIYFVGRALFPGPGKRCSADREIETDRTEFKIVGRVSFMSTVLERCASDAHLQSVAIAVSILHVKQYSDTRSKNDERFEFSSRGDWLNKSDVIAFEK